MTPGRKSILLLGATGLVGRECLRLLVENDAFSKVVVLARRPLGGDLAGPKVEAHVVDFDHLTAAAPFFDVDKIICALGTTIGQAGSRDHFRTVDLVYPLTAAHLGIERKVSHFLLVSALGADSGSLIFYNRIKGELEDAVSALPYRLLTIARPSVLVGKRDHLRTGERIAAGLGFVFPLLRPIKASDVARALVHQAILDEPGRRVLLSTELRQIAGHPLPSGPGEKAARLEDEPIPRSSVA
jgi:uncharacterized protein YbjT (DUF2867 family)